MQIKHSNALTFWSCHRNRTSSKWLQWTSKIWLILSSTWVVDLASGLDSVRSQLSSIESRILTFVARKRSHKPVPKQPPSHSIALTKWPEASFTNPLKSTHSHFPLFNMNSLAPSVGHILNDPKFSNNRTPLLCEWQMCVVVLEVTECSTKNRSFIQRRKKRENVVHPFPLLHPYST